MAAAAKVGKYLRIADVAAQLHVPASTVRSWVGRGLLPAMKVGAPGSRRAVVLIDEADLLALLARSRRPSAAEAAESARGQ